MHSVQNKVDASTQVDFRQVNGEDTGKNNGKDTGNNNIRNKLNEIEK